MKLRYVLPAVGFGILFATFAFMLYRTEVEGYSSSTLQSPLLGKPAPIFRLSTVEDPAKFVDTTDFKSAYLVNVWATWCVECRHEHATLLAIAKQNVIPIVGLDTKDDLAAAQQWLSRLGNPYTATAFDEDGRVAVDWGVYGAPETFLVDEQGKVVYKHVGPLSMTDWQEHFLPRIGRSQSASQSSGAR